MLTTIPSNNPNRRNRLNFKWLCGNSPRFVSLLGLICVNTGGHSSPPSRPAGDGEKTSPVGRLSMPRGRFSMPMSRARGRLRHGGGAAADPVAGAVDESAEAADGGVD